MMSTLWAVVLLLAAAPNEAAAGKILTLPSVAGPDQPLVEPRTGAKLRDATQAALRRWAKPGDKAAEQAAREFLVLYEELRRDDQLPPAEREQLSAKIRGRLSSLARQIERRAAAQQRRAGSDRPQSLDAVAQGAAVLAQWGARGRQPGQLGGGWPGGNGTAGAMQSDDAGQQLVELIQQTIAPQTWDVNGGPGSIYYWRPGRALAIRATEEVHEEIGGLLEQLQRAGR
jgi:hypothetical protein